MQFLNVNYLNDLVRIADHVIYLYWNNQMLNFAFRKHVRPVYLSLLTFLHFLLQ